jgi:hypothetical protein
MNLVPTRIQEQAGRVDRNYSLVIGLFAGLTALWSVYRLFWLLYSATVLSSFGLSTASLLFSFVLWGVIGVVAGVVSAAFLLRYAKQP